MNPARVDLVKVIGEGGRIDLVASVGGVPILHVGNVNIGVDAEGTYVDLRLRDFGMFEYDPAAVPEIDPEPEVDSGPDDPSK